MAAVGATMFRRSTRSTLLRLVALGCERRSDEAAVVVLGERLEVATTLLAARRASRHAPAHGVLALNGVGSLEARVRMLVDGSALISGSRLRVLIGVGLLMGAGLLTGNVLHHEIETILSHFVH